MFWLFPVSHRYKLLQVFRMVETGVRAGRAPLLAEVESASQSPAREPVNGKSLRLSLLA